MGFPPWSSGPLLHSGEKRQLSPLVENGVSNPVFDKIGLLVHVPALRSAPIGESERFHGASADIFTSTNLIQTKQCVKVQRAPIFVLVYSVRSS